MMTADERKLWPIGGHVGVDDEEDDDEEDEDVEVVEVEGGG